MAWLSGQLRRVRGKCVYPLASRVVCVCVCVRVRACARWWVWELVSWTVVEAGVGWLVVVVVDGEGR
jgi:hypothetical protein